MTDPSEPEPPSEQVQRVADLLRGSTLVVIGGERRPSSSAALKRAFELESVDWIGGRDYTSPRDFEPHIRNANVKVVVLAIRWSSHSFDDAKKYCDTYGKLFVRLKAGYNPNQVALHILDQVSDAFEQAGEGEAEPG